jgi:CRP-like cAMP-binding protein
MTAEPSQLAAISKNDFLNILRAHPDIALHVMKKLIRMVRGLNENVKSLAMLDVYGIESIAARPCDRTGRKTRHSRETHTKRHREQGGSFTRDDQPDIERTSRPANTSKSKAEKLPSRRLLRIDGNCLVHAHRAKASPATDLA